MPTKSTTIEESAAAALKRLEEKDRGLKQMVKKAYAYAVFPSVGKASLVVGGSYGRGAVFEKGKFIGHATISQFTIGVQIGGDTFTELLVFENKEALDRLKKGKMAFAANASAVLVKAGAAGTKDFTIGVAAYAYSRGGMLLEAVIGGQKFKFKPADEQEQEDQDQEEGEEQEQKGGRAGASKGKGKGQSAAAQDEDEGEEEQEDESGDEEGQEDGEGEEQESGLLGRAMGGIRSGASTAAEGVKSAASKVGETVKAHPVAATVVGTAVVAGVVMMLVRSISGAGQDGSDQQEDGDENEPEASADEGEEEQEGEEEESEESDDTLNRLRRKRSSKA